MSENEFIFVLYMILFAGVLALAGFVADRWGDWIYWFFFGGGKP